MKTQKFNITKASSDMGTSFLNLIWNYYNDKDDIINYNISPNENKDMIATIEFKDEESENVFLQYLKREVQFEILK